MRVLWLEGTQSTASTWHVDKRAGPMKQQAGRCYQQPTSPSLFLRSLLLILVGPKLCMFVSRLRIVGIAQLGMRESPPPSANNLSFLLRCSVAYLSSARVSRRNAARSGLLNLGNLCGVNATVQLLRHMRPLRQALVAFSNACKPEPQPEPDEERNGGENRT